MKIVIYIYNGMTMLDAIGPYEVLRNLEHVTIQLVAKTKGEIISDSRVVHLQAKYEIDEVEAADILLIPGATIAFVREMKDEKVLAWIKKIDATTQRTVTVCTGSMLLAATGLLKGRKATSHWKLVSGLQRYGAQPTRERMVEAGKYITAAGVSAGIDMAIFLAHQLRGTQAAQAAQLAIEYDPQPMFEAGNYTKASAAIIRRAERIMIRDARKDLSLWEMIKHAPTLLRIFRLSD